MTRFQPSARVLGLALGLALCACSSDPSESGASDGGTDAGSAPAPEAPAADAAPGATGEVSEAVSALRANVAATAARAEHGDERVKVAHILIAFAGASRSTATRSKVEAEQLTADLLQQIEDGADFEQLMRANSNDPGPGIYGMTSGKPGDGYVPRGGMVGAFGDVGWRLQVGEVGVAAHDPASSPFGWHIIKRLEAEPPPPPPVPEQAASAEALAALRDNATETAARDELEADKMKVAHILIAFAGASRSQVTRTQDEAENRAAVLLEMISSGADFEALMRSNSDDPGPGVYGMTTGAATQEYYPRGQMAGAFGDVGWRLEVGQVGVAAYDPDGSPFGWHIIKRVE